MNGQESLIKDIEAAVANRPASHRSDSLRYVTDLFVAQAPSYTEEQVSLFDDVIGRLAVHIEISSRALLAQRLAVIPNAPPRVIQALAEDDDIEVASPVLSQSECLNEATLVETARSKGQGHLLAISRRKKITQSITDVLVERGDKEVVLSTVSNAGAQFSNSGFAILVQRAEGDDQIASSVGARIEMPRHHFLKLLSVASHAVRSKLEHANPQAADEIRRVVREVTIKAQTQSVSDSFEYSKARKTIAERSVNDTITISDLCEFAATGKFEETVVGLSLLSHIAVATIERALMQERTELLLSILKTCGLQWADVKLILQLRARNHAMSMADVEQCLASYERLKPTTAKLVVDYHCRPSKPK
jgi:uncharacterized protein (DUF2336 family)